MDINEYCEKFCETIAKEFSFHEDGAEIGYYHMNVYESEDKYGLCNFKVTLFGRKRSNGDLTIEWLKKYFQTHTPFDVMMFAYKNIPPSDLKTYKDMVKITRWYHYNDDLESALKLLKIYKRINISLEELTKKYLNYVRDEDFYFKNIDKFINILKRYHNSKISELWWIWRDYSGEYESYIEWLPRETLEELLMVSNSGKYQPDYTTYVE